MQFSVFVHRFHPCIFVLSFVDWLDNYHKDDDPDGDPDDNVDVVVNLLHENGPAATEVEGVTVGTISASPTGLEEYICFSESPNSTLSQNLHSQKNPKLKSNTFRKNVNVSQ